MVPPPTQTGPISRRTATGTAKVHMLLYATIRTHHSCQVLGLKRRWEVDYDVRNEGGPPSRDHRLAWFGRLRLYGLLRDSRALPRSASGGGLGACRLAVDGLPLASSPWSSLYALPLPIPCPSLVCRSAGAVSSEQTKMRECGDTVCQLEWTSSERSITME